VGHKAFDRGRLLILAPAIIIATIVMVISALTEQFGLGGALAAFIVGLGAVVNVAVSTLGPRVSEHLSKREEQRRLLRDHCRFLNQHTTELPQVRETRDPLDLGVRKVPLTAPAAATSDGVPRDWPLYVRRDVDEELDKALEDGGVVLLVGDAHAGKSRTAFEAMHRVCKDRLLFVPKRQESPRVLADAGFTFPRTVVWLDDLDGYLGVSQIDKALDDLVCQFADSVVLATMRSGEYAQHVGESPSRNPGAQHGSGNATPGLFRSNSRLLGDKATIIPMSPHWSQDERRRARDRAKDPRIAEALDQSGTFRLVEYMTSGPQLWKKWRDALLGVQPVGAAIVAAAVDCRRIGHFRPVPVDLLQRLYEGYLEDPEGARIPGAFEDGLAWARRDYALIKPIDDGAGGQSYVASDYLVDAVQRNPDAYPVPEATWRLVVECLEPDEAWDVGAAAYRAKLPRIAERAFRVGTRASRTEARGNAAYGLANVLLDLGETAEAETWFKDAADAGVTAAAVNLGWLLERRGDRQQAEWYYRQAYRRGDVDAANNLGVLFAESGNDGAAEEWLSKAHKAGHSKATINLGLLLLRRGDRDGARRLFRQAAALGDTEAEEHLRALPPDGPP
jgi:tetratricopeptide (TPR) repeat protein